MVDQKKLHHPISAILDQRRVGSDSHAWGNSRGTTNLRARHPSDLWLSIGRKDRLPVWTHLRSSHLKKTHPAIAHYGEFGVIAVVRDHLLGSVSHFDHIQPPRHLHPHPINLYIDQIVFILGHVVVPRVHGMGGTAAHRS